MKSFEFSLYDAEGKEHKYIVNEHPTSEGIRTQVFLVKLFLPFSPLLAFAMDVLDNKKTDEEWIPEFKNMISGELIASLKEEEILTIFKLLTKYAARDGKNLTEESYEIVFAGNYSELYDLVWRVIKANFSSVLSMFHKKIQMTRKERTAKNSSAI